MKNLTLMVGQRIYLLHKMKTRITPCQVVEEVIKRSLKGEVTSYKINTGSEELFLETILNDFVIFESLSDAKKFLIERFIFVVNELTVEVEKNTIELFGSEDMPFSEANIQAE